jgi:hypothetical protein
MAPAGFIVNELPGHIVPLFTVIGKAGLTVTVDVSTVERHPKALLPITVYVVVVVGLTIALPPAYV